MSPASDGVPAARVVGLIWAQAANGVIGADGRLPWYLPEDLAHFRETTRGSVVVMGRRTWDSLPPRFRPLPGRRNIVLTRGHGWSAPGAEVAGSIEEALAAVPPELPVWIIGGAAVYRAGLPVATRVVRTELEQAADGDVLAPHLDAAWRAVSHDPAEGWHLSVTGLRYRFTTLERSVM